MEIDRDGPTPVYEQVAEVIRQRITSGELRPNLPIPGLTGLVQEFGIARGTAAKVLELLESEGLVRKVRGKGTFVVPQE